MGIADDTRLVRRVRRARQPPPDLDVDESAWPFTLEPVAQLLREGLELKPGVTFLVGENGSGKSTIVEAIAMAYGFDPEGGTRYTKRSTYSSESPLDRVIEVVRSLYDTHWGFFLRAESMHGWYTHQESVGRGRHDPNWHELSHGESFLEVLKRRFDSVGFYVLDEDGFHEANWEDLDLVTHWRNYLEDPQLYLRHLLADRRLSLVAGTRGGTPSRPVRTTQVRPRDPRLLL